MKFGVLNKNYTDVYVYEGGWGILLRKSGVLNTKYTDVYVYGGG